MQFRDRYDAAMRLIPLLEKYKNESGVVLVVPKGGVSIGYYIAKTYRFPLELLLTKKIGHPESRELAIGAVSMQDFLVDKKYNVPDSYIEDQVKIIRETLAERYRIFMGDGHQPPEMKDKIVIIVDDGIATGNTLLSALKMIRNKSPRKTVVAVPVSPPETASKLAREVDEFISLLTPGDFFGVGQYYMDFAEVSDREVIRMVREINQVEKAA